jgi:hypothetical protein
MSRDADRSSLAPALALVAAFGRDTVADVRGLLARELLVFGLALPDDGRDAISVVDTTVTGRLDCSPGRPNEAAMPSG